ncbi:hypothetical protein NUU61_003274 [Penicillium alfredii]|uniref:Extracellular membrane protein CFEM domain-containing protein n=1 Tax=Penicillium alfredii TaxID=1506179 RepID=A0A9W9FT97_9EURO|nr:uncharacterized protein NUU61_003274 [Penicillium alfredii]KAJ5105927.1 hypothetical protein NUU61_003274 [Penicillium alfredii]
MRSFLATLFIAGAVAQTTSDFLKCANAAFGSVDTSKLSDCSDKDSTDCFCANKDAISSLTKDAEDVCADAGVDLNDLSSSLCGDSDRMAKPARKASHPMERVGSSNNNKRAYMPEASAASAAPRVVYVTETRTECACKSSKTPLDPMHISQIPVDVPASSSMMGGMAAAATPASSSYGAMVVASSASAFGSASGTPTPSGASARYNAFQGAAPKVGAVHSGVAALGVAAVMGLMVAL